MKCFFLAAVCFLLVVVGCRKETDEKNPQNTTRTDEMSNLAGYISASQWQSGASWNEVNRPTHTVFYSNFPMEISDDDLEGGLIRVFEISEAEGAQARTLPFEETMNGQKYYCYYLVKKNAVMVAVDVYDGKTNPAVNSHFQTVVFSKAALESNEKTKADLMQLSYERISRLLSP
jgi:hypothetical protein